MKHAGTLMVLILALSCGGEDGERAASSVHINGPCSYDWQCSDKIAELTCRAAAATETGLDMRCLNLALEGEFCDDEGDCQNELFCRPLYKHVFTRDNVWSGFPETVTRWRGQCAPIAGVKEACDENSDCDGELKCFEPPIGAIGSKEYHGWCYYRQCEGELFCDNGEVCRWDSWADTLLDSIELNFNVRFNRCQPPSAEGETCHEDVDCEKGLVCLDWPSTEGASSGKCGSY